MNAIVAQPRDKSLEPCEVAWCEGHTTSELEREDPDDLVHGSRSIHVELPVGEAGGAVQDHAPAYFQVERVSSVVDGDGLLVALQLEKPIAPESLRTFTDSLREFATYLDINGPTVI